MHRRFSLATLAVVCLLFVAQHAAAQAINWDGTTTSTRNGGFVVGSLIEVDGGSDQVITHLGAQEINSAFGGGSYDVGIWDETGGTLLGSVTVTSSSQLIDTYRYEPLASPLTLLAGDSYLLAADPLDNNTQWFLDGFLDNPQTSGYSGGPGFDLIENRFANGSSLTAPTTNGGGNLGRWGPANAISIQPVPEPGTIFVWGALGTMGLGILMWRRRRQCNR